jgi:hypothetical protein
MASLDVHRKEPAMLRTIFEQTHRFRERLPLPVPLSTRVTFRVRIILAVTAVAALLAIAAVYAPQSARSNLALCLKAMADEPSSDGKIASSKAKSAAIARCIN